MCLSENLEPYFDSQNFGDLLDDLEDEDWFKDYNDIDNNEQFEMISTNLTNIPISNQTPIKPNQIQINFKQTESPNLVKNYLDSLNTKKRKVSFIFYTR